MAVVPGRGDNVGDNGEATVMSSTPRTGHDVSRILGSLGHYGNKDITGKRGDEGLY